MLDAEGQYPPHHCCEACDQDRRHLDSVGPEVRRHRLQNLYNDDGQEECVQNPKNALRQVFRMNERGYLQGNVIE